ncbi:MAG: hypothetical protein MUC92_02000 [Fimbriimonadaceae bacterium]|jgi:hypothetical protein|nr:hypothetical protein [Fimbriimonadaceae bacterium]
MLASLASLVLLQQSEKPSIYVSCEPFGEERSTLIQLDGEARDEKARQLGFFEVDSPGYTLWIKGDPFQTRRMKLVFQWLSSLGEKVEANGVFVDVDLSEKPEDDFLASVIALALGVSLPELIRPQKAQIGFCLKSTDSIQSGGTTVHDVRHWPDKFPKGFAVDSSKRETRFTKGIYSFQLGRVLTAQAKARVWNDIWQKNERELATLEGQFLSEIEVIKAKILALAPDSFRINYESPPSLDRPVSEEHRAAYLVNPGLIQQYTVEEAERFLSRATYSGGNRGIGFMTMRSEPGKLPSGGIQGLLSFLELR